MALRSALARLAPCRMVHTNMLSELVFGACPKRANGERPVRLIAAGRARLGRLGDQKSLRMNQVCSIEFPRGATILRRAQEEREVLSASKGPISLGPCPARALAEGREDAPARAEDSAE